ncbi:MAG: hypothetical protein MJ252_16790 [archaeon]|nr:hypothetical protein [archaeon]
MPSQKRIQSNKEGTLNSMENINTVPLQMNLTNQQNLFGFYPLYQMENFNALGTNFVLPVNTVNTLSTIPIIPMPTPQNEPKKDLPLPNPTPKETKKETKPKIKHFNKIKKNPTPLFEIPEEYTMTVQEKEMRERKRLFISLRKPLPEAFFEPYNKRMRTQYHCIEVKCNNPRNKLIPTLW